MASSSSKSFLLLISVLSIAILLIYSDVAHARNLLETNEVKVTKGEAVKNPTEDNKDGDGYGSYYPSPRPATYPTNPVPFPPP